MKLDDILAHIRGMRDREGVQRIISAAEARDAKLGSIEGERERSRLWEKFAHLRVGDMVFIHEQPRTVTRRERYRKLNGKWGYRQVEKITASGQHRKLWGKMLSVHAVRPRNREIVVRVPGSTLDHRLSPHTCVRLKLSQEPHPEAFANALRKETTDPFANARRRSERRRLATTKGQHR